MNGNLLIPSYCLFNDIKHIDINFLSINKKCIKILTHEIKYITTQHINNPNIDKELPPCISLVM